MTGVPNTQNNVDRETYMRIVKLQQRVHGFIFMLLHSQIIFYYKEKKEVGYEVKNNTTSQNDDLTFNWLQASHKWSFCVCDKNHYPSISCTSFHSTCICSAGQGYRVARQPSVGQGLVFSIPQYLKSSTSCFRVSFLPARNHGGYCLISETEIRIQ